LDDEDIQESQELLEQKELLDPAGLQEKAVTVD